MQYEFHKRCLTVEVVEMTDGIALERFKKDNGTKTFPQVFVDGVRIGGYDFAMQFLEAGDKSR